MRSSSTQLNIRTCEEGHILAANMTSVESTIALAVLEARCRKGFALPQAAGRCCYYWRNLMVDGTLTEFVMFVDIGPASADRVVDEQQVGSARPGVLPPLPADAVWPNLLPARVQRKV